MSSALPSKTIYGCQSLRGPIQISTYIWVDMSDRCLVDKNLEGRIEEWKAVPRSNEPEGQSGAGGLL